jgi:hypothetical protein
LNILRQILKSSTLYVLIITAIANSQESGYEPGDLSSLDSLLLSGDMKTILSLSSDYQLHGQNNQYGILFRHFQEISQASDQMLQKRCQELANQSLRFQRKYIGVYAEVMLDKFQKANLAENWKEALMYYSIALYFRSQYIRNEKVRLKANLATAEKLYRNQKFDEVLQAVDNYKLEDHANPAYQTLKDSLDYIYEQLESRSNNGLDAIRKEQEAEIVMKRVTISFSYGLSSIPSQPRGQGILRFEELQFDTEPLPNVIQSHYTIQFDYFFSPAVSLSAQLKNGRIYNDNVFVESFGTPDPAKVYFQKDYSSWTIGSSVYYREKTGIRPFTRLLLGVLNAHTHKAKMQSSKWEAYEVYATLEDMSKMYPYLSIEIGGEVEPSAHGLLFFGLYFSISNDIGEMTSIKNFSGSVDLRMGINVL